MHTTTTQQAIRQSIDNTNTVLNALSPPQLRLVRQDTSAEFDRWCCEEWIPVKEAERAVVARRKRVAQECAVAREMLAFGAVL